MRLIYVADPMCSWCYGFGPQLADLRARLADTLGAPVPVTL
ncbi:DsbA family protein, partial [Ralstonia pseudosolanacearum]